MTEALINHYSSHIKHFIHMYEVSVGVNNARFRCLRLTSLSRREDFLFKSQFLFVRSLCFLFLFSFFLPALGVNGITLVPAC